LKILVRRSDFPTCTADKIQVNGAPFCFGLEDPVREVEGQSVESWKIAGDTAIPFGTYAVEITYSNRFKRDMPQVMCVPGFEGIRIHGGNTTADTEGCLLVGTVADPNRPDRISNCQPILAKLYGMIDAAIDAGEDVTITFEKEPNNGEAAD
jgi:hypothetical protein